MKVRSPARTFLLMRVSWSHLVLCLRVCWLFMAEKRNGCVDVLELFLCALFPISQLYLAPTFLQPIKNIKELPLLRSCVHILQTIQFNQKLKGSTSTSVYRRQKLQIYSIASKGLPVVVFMGYLFLFS